MFSPPRSISKQLILIAAMGLSACSSVFGTPSTPTPSEPSPTPVPPTPTPPPLAATVNGEYITLAEYEAELERYRSALAGNASAPSGEQARQTVLDDLIDQVLLSRGAREAGYELTEADLQARIDDLGAETLAGWMDGHGYTDESFRLALKRAVEAAWMRDKIIAAVPLEAEQIHIQQILTYNEDTAKNVLDQLNAGTDFDDLAVIYDPNTHGELGWVPRGYLLNAQVEQAAFDLEVGAHSPVIATPAGFHIVKLLERDPQHPLSPDALLAMRELALRDWLRRQREDSRIDPAR